MDRPGDFDTTAIPAVPVPTAVLPEDPPRPTGNAFLAEEQFGLWHAVRSARLLSGVA
ncbi:hypothetical protein [Streptomyces cyaneochromogenes]|uniref:hypothetical protein n=1 Tax=Streptomyces cyaneochromogenes TaxID=2496836 RepID=UPI00158D534E|nr:hypothetical protein [Streptomyces cyaneochromogenes]